MMNGEFIKALVEETKPEFTERDGELFSNKRMYRVHENTPLADPLHLSTLDGLLEYIESEVDFDAEHTDPMIIHIASPTSVYLYRSLNEDRDRECLAAVAPRIPQFSFGQFMDAETFTIKLMSMFKDTIGEDGRNDRDKVLKYIGTAETGSLQAYGDDGVSQSVTIQKTTTSKEAAIVPNPVIMFPYRTFLEVDQPGSPFIFRMKDGPSGMTAALFEADGGMWQIEAVDNIRLYLMAALKDLGKEFSDHFIVIG